MKIRFAWEGSILPELVEMEEAPEQGNQVALPDGTRMRVTEVMHYPWGDGEAIVEPFVEVYCDPDGSWRQLPPKPWGEKP